MVVEMESHFTINMDISKESEVISRIEDIISKNIPDFSEECLDSLRGQVSYIANTLVEKLKVDNTSTVFYMVAFVLCDEPEHSLVSVQIEVCGGLNTVLSVISGAPCFRATLFVDLVSGEKEVTKSIKNIYKDMAQQKPVLKKRKVGLLPSVHFSGFLKDYNEGGGHIESKLYGYHNLLTYIKAKEYRIPPELIYLLFFAQPFKVCFKTAKETKTCLVKDCLVYSNSSDQFILTPDGVVFDSDHVFSWPIHISFEDVPDELTWEDVLKFLATTDLLCQLSPKGGGET